MKCNSCDLDKPEAQMVKHTGKIRPYCNICNRKRVSEWRLKYPERWKESRKRHYLEMCKGKPRYLAKRRVYMLTYRLTPEFHYTEMKYRCKEMNFPCDISLEAYTELTSGSCYYCNGALPKTGIGLDQIIPRGGYTMNNVRPCCDDCNTAKNDLTENQFLNLIENIYKNLSEKKICRHQ